MEKRNFIRTSLPCDFSAHFQVEGQTCSPIRISNLSIHGCCLQLPTALAQRLSDKPVLDNFILSRDTREFPLKGRIVWHASGDKDIKAGVEFLETNKDCLRALRESVAQEMLFWNTAS
jgi:hypothetical protein